MVRHLRLETNIHFYAWQRQTLSVGIENEVPISQA